jgi:hypothetical protein
MRSTTSILALQYMPVSVSGGVRKAVGGFLRYITFRDQHVETEGHGLDGFVRYVAHRDRTSPHGRVFGDTAQVTNRDRKQLIDYIARSTKGLQPKWVRNRDGVMEDRQRAVYQFIFSPKDWRGLDLRLVARKALKQLEMDAGVGGLPPWFAAEHRNTDHRHVHVVLAARREIAPGRFSALLITRERLKRMKTVIKQELERQRRVERGFTSLGHGLDRLRAVARQYHHQMERELEEELSRHRREAWAR